MVALRQSYQFGSSQYLQSNDYQATAQFPNFATDYIKTAATLTLPLTAQHVTYLSSTQLNQFRFTLTPDTFTNWQGMAAPGRIGVGCAVVWMRNIFGVNRALTTAARPIPLQARTATTLSA